MSAEGDKFDPVGKARFSGLVPIVETCPQFKRAFSLVNDKKTIVLIQVIFMK